MNDNRYFERLHTEETRRAEWRMLDAALAERTAHIAPHGIRAVVGHWMMDVGAWLAGEPLPKCHEPHVARR